MTSESPHKHEPSPDVSFLTRLIGTGFFVGYIPWASGTFGSLVGILVYLLPGASEPAVLFAIIIAGLVLGTPAAARIAESEGHRLTGTAEFTKRMFQPGHAPVPDPSIVVIDEMVGTWISLVWLPKSLLAVALAFVLFRVMDILKPEPARMMERIPYGLGIMLDDVIAGLYANLAAHVILYILTVTTHSV